MTLTLDPDVARLVVDAMHRDRQSMKQVVNDALRRALTPASTRDEQYQLEPHPSALRPGYDLMGFNPLADKLEDEAIMDKARRPA